MALLLHTACLSVACIITDGAGAHRSLRVPPASVHTAVELRQMLRESQAAIRSLRVVYRGRGKDAGSSPPGLYIRREIAADASGRLFHHGAHGFDGLDWRDDLLQQRHYLTREHAHNEFPLKRTYTQARYPVDTVLPGTLQGELFFDFTGLWPFDSRPAPRPFGRPHVLREVARCEDYSMVREQQERVDGRWCHILEMPGVDCLWLDARRGACLLAREVFDPKTGRQVTRLELCGHHEVGAGIWLPSRIKSVRYDFRARTDEQSKRKVTDSEIQILGITVNDVDDCLFEFHPAAGSLSRSLDDPTSVYAQTEAGGLDYIDSVVRWIERHHGAQKTSFDRRFAGYGYLVCVPFLLIVAYLHTTGARGKHRS